MNFIRFFTMIGLSVFAIYGMNRYCFADKEFDRKLGLMQYILYAALFVIGIAVLYN